MRYKGNKGTAEDVEVLLITSRGGKGWVIPKGGWEDDETVEAAAKRETVEEAGVRGSIEVRLPAAVVIGSCIRLGTGEPVLLVPRSFPHPFGG